MTHKVINYWVKDLTEIIQGCLKNDRRSQYHLYDYCFDGMMSICMRYMRNEEMALEVLNTAFIKVLKNIESYDPEKDFKPWYSRITVNESIDRYRQQVRWREKFEYHEDEFESTSSYSDSDNSSDWEEAEYLESLLDKLKESEKTVFNMFAIDGYSHKEIAEMLEISERSSIRHLTNAREKLKGLLAKNEFGIRKA